MKNNSKKWYNLDVRHIGIVLIVLVFVSYTAYDVLRPPNIGSDKSSDIPERPELDATYYEENESLTITVMNGSFTSKSGRVKLKEMIYEPRKNRYSANASFTIKGYNKTEETSIWAKRSLYGLGIGNPGMTDFPIEEGEKITVISDGTDKNNNGLDGIEEGEIVQLHNKDNDNDVEVRGFEIINETAVKTRYGIIINETIREK